MTAWELVIKQALSDLTLQKPVSVLLHTHSLTELPVTIQHRGALRDLPFHHRDPFDRLLIAQAMIEGLILVTGDKLLLRYGIPTLLV